MRTAFSINAISLSEPLFGRDKIVNRLITSAIRGENLSLTGIRRVGKTSIVKRVFGQIRKMPDVGVYPVYIDVKESNIHGTLELYKLLIARTLTELYKDKVISENLLERGIEINISESFEDTLDNMSDLRLHKCQSIFERIIDFAFSIQRKTLIIAFDEYEYIFKNILDNHAGFMKIRTLSSACPDEETGRNKFAFWVIGVRRWDDFCDDVGSGEANTIGCYENVTPLEEDDFKSMWTYECNLLESKDCALRINNLCDDAYNHCGGIPFFGKLIGSFVVRNGEYPTYENFQAPFKEVLSSLGQKMLNVMQCICLDEPISESNDVSLLRQNGLIKKMNKGYIIPFIFLKDYLKNNLSATYIPQANLSRTQLCDEITELIEKINKQRMLTHKSCIFDIPTDIHSTIKDLKEECQGENQYALFSLALYRIIFEWTKRDGNARQTLYDIGAAFRNHRFVKCVDMNRHIFGKAHVEDKLNENPNSISKSDMLSEILGEIRMPKSQNDYLTMQLGLLNKFKAYLVEIEEFLTGGNALLTNSYSGTVTNYNYKKEAHDTRNDKKIAIPNKYEGTNLVRENTSNIILKENEVYEGTINEKKIILPEYKWRICIDKKNGYSFGWSPKEYEYSENEHVLFEIKLGVNYQTGRPFPYAINIHPKKG